MKFLFILVLALATAFTFDLRHADIKQRNVVIPVKEADGLISNAPLSAAVDYERINVIGAVPEDEDTKGLFLNDLLPVAIEDEGLIPNVHIPENVEAEGLISPVATVVQDERLTANVAVPEDKGAEGTIEKAFLAFAKEYEESAPVDYEGLTAYKPADIEEGLTPNIPVAVAVEDEEHISSVHIPESVEAEGLIDNVPRPAAIQNEGPTILKNVEDGQGHITNNAVPAAIDIEGRITNGQYARDGQIPYQAYLSIYNGGNIFCGGSLIGRNWVVSAAHCTRGARQVTVHLGSLVNDRGQVRHTVYSDSIINHSGYTSNTHQNDISLIRIPTVTYNSRIQPIRLPSISGNYNTYSGHKAIASGWGQTEGSRVSSYLKWAYMTVISNNQCRRTFNWLPSSNVCVSTYGGVSTCFGDSGGPLVLESSRTLIGITSFLASYNCVRGDPAAFTRVTSYLNWIKHYTGIYY